MTRHSRVRSAVRPAYEVLYKIGTIFQVIAVIVWALNCLNFIAADRITDTYEPLEAIISSIDDDDKQTTISYTIGAEQYETTLSFWSSNAHIGDSVTVYRGDPSNPYDIVAVPGTMGLSNQSDFIDAAAGFIVGIVLILLGSVFKVKYINYKRKLRYLKTFGIPVDAHIVHIADSAIQVFGRTAKIFVCQYTDERGRTLIFDSEPIAINQDKPQLCNDLVRVYMDTRDYNNYIVDHTTIQIV